MKPIVIYARASSTAQKIVEQLNVAGARAYYNADASQALVVRWAQGGDKFHELRQLTAAGVPTPRHGLEPVPGWIPRRQHHQEARDFTEPPVRGYFWTEPTYTDHEFRVHVMRDLAFRTQYKYLPRGVRPLVKYGVPIRNHSLGWRFNPDPDFPLSVLDLIRHTARAAVLALGYDMGAVDVGFVEPDRPVVFEINTRPSMDKYTQAAYVETLMKLASQ